MNQVPNLESQEEEESPPPLPARSGNLYIDTPPNTGSRSQNPRAPPPLSNEVPAPALPPKPPRMKLVGMIKYYCPKAYNQHYIWLSETINN